MSATTTARRLTFYGSNLRPGQTITVTQVTGVKVTGQIKRINAADRRTGQRKATLTDGRVVLVNTHEVVSVAR